MNSLEKDLNEIKKSGLYSLEQRRIIEYAMGIVGINEKLIINPLIPSEYMSMYIRLMQIGIDITKYVNINWKLEEIPAYDLEGAILAEHGISREEAKVLRKNKY